MKLNFYTRHINIANVSDLGTNKFFTLFQFKIAKNDL